MPCEDPGMGRDGWGCDRPHIQDGDSIIEFNHVVTEVNEAVKRRAL